MMTTPNNIRTNTDPDSQGVSTIPYNLSNNVIAMNIPSVIQMPYLTRKRPGLRAGWMNFWTKSPMIGSGHMTHQILPNNMNVKGTRGHHKVQARIEPGLREYEREPKKKRSEE